MCLRYFHKLLRGDERVRMPVPVRQSNVDWEAGATPVISVEEARARILAGLRPTPAEIVPLADAWGRVAAVPVLARLTQPPADVSAMDGYALRATDGANGSIL